MANAKRNCFTPVLMILYAVSLTLIAVAFISGWVYYSAPLAERPHLEMHTMLKPGGLIGHGYGIVGSAMILLLFLYSLRKRQKFGIRWGKTSKWLNVHILFGIVGPLLVTLHTAFKFNGIVSIGYFSMLAVMFSGIFGRYIYIQIPRGSQGAEMELGDIQSAGETLGLILKETYGLTDTALAMISSFSEISSAGNNTGVKAMFAIALNDIKRPFRFQSLKKQILSDTPDIPPKAIAEAMKLAKRKALLERRRAYLDTFVKLFHYWHVIHKPFAYIMVAVMIIHVFVAVLFGYRWIF
jgi:hypothetical protein